MRNPLLTLLLLVLVAAGANADDSFRNAHRAQALLGSDVWSQIIKIENTSRGGLYPASLHALVFELEGILWFYSDLNGTQSFSLHRNRLAEEKADFAPLLRDIEPGFVRWTVVAAGPTEGLLEHPVQELRNGCFIESYAMLRRLVARGVEVSEPRLLSYYARQSGNGQGHTVLAYAVPGQVVVIDPVQPEVKRGFSAALAANPQKLARALLGPEVKHARVLPLAVPVSPGVRDLLASYDSNRAVAIYY